MGLSRIRWAGGGRRSGAVGRANGRVTVAGSGRGGSGSGGGGILVCVVPRGRC